MNDSQETFKLACRDASDPPMLVGVKAQGRLDGVLFTLTLQQTYRNDSPRNLEVVYTFPLPHEAVLLSFAAELAGKKLQGTILPRADAEQRYEDALAVGDAPVLLEVSASGIHTASIGNLKPGESVMLEVRFAQLLRFEQGRLRVVLPTTIAPRYGKPDQAGLQPLQVPEVSLLADCPLDLSVYLGGDLAWASIECPTHPHRLIRDETGLRVELAPGASLDRNVVLIVQTAEQRPDLLLTAVDPLAETSRTVALAAFEIPRNPIQRPVSIKLLVDCSGSMAGDSIESARRALHGLAQLLNDGDEVSLSRFGDQVEHALAPIACTPRNLERLRTQIDATAASLGGTEMQKALTAVFGLRTVATQSDVLLITDGQVWQADELAQAARASGHRVFTIGVGSAPAEPVLRALAQATGGACEFATPGEALQQAASRMLARMREQTWTGLQIDWGVPTTWQQTQPDQAYGGDTLLAFAEFDGVKTPAAAPAQARLMLPAADGTLTEVARSSATTDCEGEDLARIAMATRLHELEGDQALQAALRYRLLTDRTQCVLVHERSEADRATEGAELHRVQSMLAAGWGGTGRAIEADLCLSQVQPSQIRFSHMDLDASPGQTMFRKSRGVSAPQQAAPVSLVQLADSAGSFLALFGALDDLPAHCRDMDLPTSAVQALADLQQLGATAAQAWLLLAGWAAGRPGPEHRPAAVAAFAPHLDALDPGLRQRAWQLLDRQLGNARAGMSRLQRLAAAMTRR